MLFIFINHQAFYRPWVNGLYNILCFSWTPTKLQTVKPAFSSLIFTATPPHFIDTSSWSQFRFESSQLQTWVWCSLSSSWESLLELAKSSAFKSQWTIDQTVFRGFFGSWLWWLVLVWVWSSVPSRSCSWALFGWELFEPVLCSIEPAREPEIATGKQRFKDCRVLRFKQLGGSLTACRLRSPSLLLSVWFSWKPQLTSIICWLQKWCYMCSSVYLSSLSKPRKCAFICQHKHFATFISSKCECLFHTVICVDLFV